MLTFKLDFSKETEYADTWLSFYPKFGLGKFTIQGWGYFDPRPQINTSLTFLMALIGVCLTGFSLYSIIFIPFLIFTWGQMYIHLPLNTGKKDEAENPDWGFYLADHGSSKNPFSFDYIVFQLGNKSKFVYMPWYLEWYRSSIMLKDGSWESEYRGLKKDFWNEEWKNKQYKESHIYNYKLKSGEEQKVETDIYVDEREWRRKGLMFLPWFNKVNKTIDVHFKEEVGEGRGSWKGGVIGCNYTMKIGETPTECLRRMEKERTFSR